MKTINCEICLIISWSGKCYFCYKWSKKNVINDTQLYVLVVTLSTQGEEKLLQELKSGFR